MKKTSSYITEKYGLDRKPKGKNGKLSFIQACQVVDSPRPERQTKHRLTNSDRIFYMVMVLGICAFSKYIMGW